MIIKHLELHTDNLDATEQFYKAVLDLNPIEKRKSCIAFEIGRSILTFIKSENINPVYHIAFDVPTNQLMDAFNWLEKRTLLLPVTDNSKLAEFPLWNAKSFYFFDNNGNILELISRFDENYESAAQFSSGSFLSISEIGIVTDDVFTYTNSLIENYDLNVYEKQPRMNNFTALGDSKGLLIVVAKNRNWYPTDRKAQSFWSRITIQTDKGCQVVITNPC